MTEKTLKGLESLLSKFNLDDLKNYALKDFPALTWLEILSMVERCKERLSPKTVASFMVFYATQNNMSDTELNDIISTLKLRAFGLSKKSTWYAYEFKQRIPDFDAPPFKDIAKYIGRSVKAKVIAIEGPHNLNSILIAITRTRRPIMMLLTDNYIFVTQRSLNVEILNDVAKGMGWKSAESCKLSGQDLPSLLKVLNKKKGATHIEAFKAKAIYKPRPRRAKHGLDFTTGDAMKTFLKNWLGSEENAPCLPQLTLQTLAPFPQGQNSHHIHTTAILTSANVQKSLTDMVTTDTIKHTSLFFDMITKHCKTDMKIKLS